MNNCMWKHCTFIRWHTVHTVNLELDNNHPISNPQGWLFQLHAARKNNPIRIHINTTNILQFELIILFNGWSQWPRGVRRRSTATRLLWSWVQIPLGAWMLSVVCVVCCQVEVSAMSWSLILTVAHQCVWSQNFMKQGGHSLRWAAQPDKIINNNII
jgi:hypothetical protein